MLFDETFLRQLEYLRVVSRRAFRGTAAGSQTGGGAGPGLEFSEHRPYVPGDDYRYLDWSAFARLGKLLLRLCQKEEDISIYFLLDASASMSTGDPVKFDHARRLVAALAYIGLANLERISILSFDTEIRRHLKPRRGKGQIFRVLNFLEGLDCGGETALEESAQEFLHHAERRGVVVLISDLEADAGYESALGLLAGRGFDLWCLQEVSPQELLPPWTGEVRITDSETGKGVSVAMTPEVARQVAEAQRSFISQAQQYCVSRGIRHAEVRSDIPIRRLVLDILRTGGFLK